MNYLKLFENFQREQPLEKKDIIDLLEGTGIDWSHIYEFPIRNKEEKEFYLGWIVECENPNDWVYPSPRNYKVSIGEYRLEFIWKVKPNIDVLLSKITPKWKEIKEWLNSIFKDCIKYERNYDYKLYTKDRNQLLIERIYDDYSNLFFVSNNSIWSIMYDKWKMGFNDLESFIWIYLEYFTKDKVKEVRISFP
jgi:hypothetical protein